MFWKPKIFELSLASGFTGVVRREFAATNITSSAYDVSSTCADVSAPPPNVISRGCFDVSCAGIVVERDLVECGRRCLYLDDRDTENGEPKSICLSCSDYAQQVPILKQIIL